MDLVLLDIVAREVSYGLHGVCLSIDLDLVAFHDLLNSGADIADSDVDSSSLDTISSIRMVEKCSLIYLDAGVGRVLDGSEEVVISWIK